MKLKSTLTVPTLSLWVENKIWLLLGHFVGFQTISSISLCEIKMAKNC